MQHRTSSSGPTLPAPDARPRTGPTVWLRRGAFGLLVTLLVLVASGALYQAVATAIDRRSYPAPGNLVDVGGYRLHLFCTGSQSAGRPTVVLDAAFPATVSTWAWVQPELAKNTRVCAYDRAGLGWSDPGPAPRDARHHAQELHSLLKNAAIPGPYVLVGHSLGGLSVRMFADQYPDDVAGMVLIEATNPDAWQRLGTPEGVGIDRTQLAVAPWLARLGVFRLGLIPAYGSTPDLPPRQRAELQAFLHASGSLDTVRAVDTAFSTALDQVRQAQGVGAIPLAIVLGSQGDGSIEALRELFRAQAELSTNSRTVLVDGATHMGLVTNRAHAAQTATAIREVVEQARSAQAPEP